MSGTEDRLDARGNRRPIGFGAVGEVGTSAGTTGGIIRLSRPHCLLVPKGGTSPLDCVCRRWHRYRILTIVLMGAFDGWCGCGFSANLYHLHVCGFFSLQFCTLG